MSSLILNFPPLNLQSGGAETYVDLCKLQTYYVRNILRLREEILAKSFMMLVITKRTLNSKVASLKVRKGKIVPYDPDTQSIIINYLTFQIHMAVVMDKDITCIPWDKLKKRIRKQSPKKVTG